MAAPTGPQPGDTFGDGLPPSTATASSDPSKAGKADPLSAPTVVAVDPFAGRVLSHYRLEERLGAGGMGVLYRATDLTLGRVIAVKLLSRQLATDETAKTRFLREARAASALDHLNIGAIHDICEQDGELFIVMALYEGETLKQRLEKGPLTVPEAVDVLRQVALGLEAAHRAGIVHRDIKPANVLVTRNGIVKILDFGLAKLVSDSQAQTMTQAGQTMGTLRYMSPEQLRGQSVDERSDLWSLGVLAYEVLAGVSPFQADSGAATAIRILNDEPLSLTGVPGVPTWLAELVAQLLRKAPSERPQNANEVLRRLEHAAQASRAKHQPRLAPQEWFSLLKPWQRAAVVFSAVVFLAIVAVGTSLFYRRYARIRWARDQALPEIQRLAEQQQYMDAFELARKAEQYIPADPKLVKLENQFLFSMKIRTAPAGANVSLKPYDKVHAAWIYVGRTPIENARLPLGYFRWRITMPGYETIDAAFPIPTAPEIQYTLNATGSIPTSMVHIPAGNLELAGNPNIKVDDFFIDRYEVTNREYKKFVDARGYRELKYWKYPFVKDGETLRFDQATAFFRDKTDRPGPSTWELGNYSQGQDNYPVSGVSWYEAAAYAEFVGKSLPTVYHWLRATARSGPQAFADRHSDILQFSNFSGNGPAPVGSYPGLGPHGTYDMAGNVKEWCINATGDRRYILGGAWSDPVYLYQDPDARLPFDRSPTNGIRLVKYLHTGSLPEALIAAIQRFTVDYRTATPVPDAVFRIYESLYAYDRTPLDAKIEAEDDDSPYWRKQRITFNAAYDNERVIVYLFLPKNGSPPFQTVIYFPHSGALLSQSISAADLVLMDFLIKSGRALMFPIYKGTYERLGQPPAGTVASRELAIKQAKDLRRSIDYLQTRPDIDPNRLGYYGISWGGTMGPVFLATEPRIRVAVLVAGGCRRTKALPELDPVNFAPRVNIPVLMLNGRYDFLLPLETCQEPIFRLLGTAAADKRHALFDSGHAPPLTPWFKESLNWFDQYLGPVK